MGKSAPPERAAANHSVKKSSTNYELRITNEKTNVGRALRHSFFLAAILIALFSSVSAQQTDPAALAEQIEFGTVEVKRDTLLQIRNLRSAEASSAAVPALADKNDIVRATAASAVIFLPADEALEYIAPLLKDRAEIVRREAAYALGKLGNRDAVPLLIEPYMARKQAIEVKNACLVALGEIGDPAAVDFLTGIFSGKPTADNEFARRSAARSIGQIAQIFQTQRVYTVTPENFLPEKYKTFALEKYENLSEIYPQFRASVPILIKVLQTQGEDGDTKREAAFALGAIGDQTAVQILRQNANSKDYYLAEICREALLKLEKAKTPDAPDATGAWTSLSATNAKAS